jgi:acetyl-CoA C-acetyltransferase
VSIDPRTPVVVGAGQVLNHDVDDVESSEPARLIVEALRRAAEDSGAGQRLLRRADSVRCVPVIGWHYPDLAAIVAEDLGSVPRETVQSSPIGGEGPQLLVNDTARAIAAGQLDVALLGGGEAGASLRTAQLAGRTPPWRTHDGQPPPTRTLGRERAPVNRAEAAVGLAPPVSMYALIECALRGAGEATAESHLERIAGLWSRFSTVAASNPHAWIKREYTAATIATPARDNRLVCSPYTKLLTANIRVNMASALIITSAQAARDAGVPADRWVFIHAGAQARDTWHVSERETLTDSPAIRACANAATRHAGVTVDEIAHLDLYSCFPAAVQVAARELGVALEDRARPLTLTGGLTFAGGPGNNYTGHAIATLVARLREDPQACALDTAVGWYLTKHALGIYSGRPPRNPFRSLSPWIRPRSARHARTDYEGDATVEAYTLAYGRDGSAEAVVMSALTPAGERMLMRSSDPEPVLAASGSDLVGEPVTFAGGGRVYLPFSRAVPN